MDIVLDRIVRRYGELTVFSGFSRRFAQGRICCILGPSGRGKTTLLRLIAGLEAPDAGTVSGVQGKKISAVFQEDRLFENLSAEKNVLLTARRDFGRSDARSLLAELGLTENTACPLRSFSGGMRRRVAVARALAADYDLLLLDEPTRGLDADTRRSTAEVIRRHAAGRTVLWVTHDPELPAMLDADLLQLD